MSSGWNIISGFVDNIDNTGTFGIIAALTELNQEWTIDIAEPIIIDITANFRTSTPQQSFLDELKYFWGKQTVPSHDFNIYQDSVSLGWNGLSIGAQSDILQLTSTDGLVIYAPVSEEDYFNRMMRVQLGTWTDDDGTVKYGIRGVKNGKMVFELNQVGVRFSYNNDDDIADIDTIIDSSLPYQCIINSSNGDKFTNGNINTVLSVTVMKGTEDVTSQLQESNFEWKKVLQNGNYDKEWNPQYVEGSNHSKIMITQNDV